MIVQVLRAYRIGQFSIFDFATAFIGIYLLAPILSWPFAKIGIVIPRSSWIWWTLPIGILTHLVLHLHTPLMGLLFDPTGHYLLKIAFLIMIYMGARPVHRSK